MIIFSRDDDGVYNARNLWRPENPTKRANLALIIVTRKVHTKNRDYTHVLAFSVASALTALEESFMCIRSVFYLNKNNDKCQNTSKPYPIAWADPEGGGGGAGGLDPPWNCQIIDFCHVEIFLQTPSGNVYPPPTPLLRKFPGHDPRMFWPV